MSVFKWLFVGVYNRLFSGLTSGTIASSSSLLTQYVHKEQIYIIKKRLVAINTKEQLIIEVQYAKY